MSKNLSALIRYQTIDDSLRSRSKKCTWKELSKRCSQALRAQTGIDVIVSERTIKGDISNLRKGIPFGQEAPIKCIQERKNELGYYIYTDPDFSIYRAELPADLVKLLQMHLAMIKQMNVMAPFNDLEILFRRLNKKGMKHNLSESIVDFEMIPDVAGVNNFERIYNAIEAKEVLDIEYKPFQKTRSTSITVHPYRLKEYRNRWFLVGLSFREDKNTQVHVFGLERIDQIRQSSMGFIPPPTKIDTLFEDIIGVSLPHNSGVQEIVLSFKPVRGQYVLTKPIHHSQTAIAENDKEVRISLQMVVNKELVREIISFRDDVTVVSPRSLRRRIVKDIKKMLANYES